MKSLSIHSIFILFLLMIMSSCSSDDDGDFDVGSILLTVDKDVVILEGDSVLISVQVLGPLQERLQGVPLQYFADDQPLDGPVFYPEQRGRVRLSATYKDVVSTRKDVEVISLFEDVTEVGLKYNGDPYLTTEEWSVSNAFTFRVKVGPRFYEVSSDKIDLYLDGSLVNQRTQFQFSEPGIFTFQAELGELFTQPINIEVREKLNYELLTIPVVFHSLNEEQELSQRIVSKLIDTLNGAFNPPPFSKEDVYNGIVNPNASSPRIQFELAEDAPSGFELEENGIDIIGDSRQDIEETISNNNWDPEKYLNIWFFRDFEEVNRLDYYGPYPRTASRSFSRLPDIFEIRMSGLETVGESAIDSTAGLAVAYFSVIDEHPDYIVAGVANFLGLFDTNRFGCESFGDYLRDTKSIGESQGTNKYVDCEGREVFTPTNHMAVGRAYTNFTYDQVVRMRNVITYGISRPGN